MWLLLADFFVLINACANFKARLDELTKHIGFTKDGIVSQLFLRCDNHEKCSMTLAEEVNDILIAKKPKYTGNVISSVNKRLKLGSITHGSGLVMYFEVNVLQHDDM